MESTNIQNQKAERETVDRELKKFFIKSVKTFDSLDKFVEELRYNLSSLCIFKGCIIVVIVGQEGRNKVEVLDFFCCALA